MTRACEGESANLRVFLSPVCSADVGVAFRRVQKAVAPAISRLAS